MIVWHHRGARSADPIRSYFDFISPGAYLAWTQIHALAARHGRAVEPVPVRSAAMRDAWDDGDAPTRRPGPTARRRAPDRRTPKGAAEGRCSRATERGSDREGDSCQIRNDVLRTLRCEPAAPLA